MRCEVCGRKIFGKPFNVIIEGAKLTVCADCSKHGKLTWEEEPIEASSKPKARLPSFRIQRTKLPETPKDTTVELVNDFDQRIRQAREKLGLSHEDLGKRINEKVSLLRKIETKKMAPNNLLATKLEHTLKVKLIIPASEEIKTPPTMMQTKVNHELTLGDVIQLDKKNQKGKEDPAERKQS